MFSLLYIYTLASATTLTTNYAITLTPDSMVETTSVLQNTVDETTMMRQSQHDDTPKIFTTMSISNIHNIRIPDAPIFSMNGKPI